jgi:hypothetical protein
MCSVENRDETRKKVGFSPCLTLTLLLSIAGALLLLYGTKRYGPGMSPDSVNYLSIARNLAAGKGYVSYNGDPSPYWPPLLPLLLALPIRLGLNPLLACRSLNALAFAGSLFVSGLWLRKQSSGVGFCLAGLATILLSMPLLSVGLFAWSEPLFICSLLGCLYALDTYLERGGRASLFLAMVCAALSCLARYSGVTALLTGGILLVSVSPLKTGKRKKGRGKRGSEGLLSSLSRRESRDALGARQEWLRRFLRALLFGVVGALPTFGWCLRNRAVTGTLTGERAPSVSTLGQNLHASADTLSQWFLPSVIPLWLRVALLCVPIMPLGFGVAARRNREQKDGIEGLHAMTPLCFCLVYAIYLLIAATLTDTDRLDDRLWSPLYVPLIWGVFAMAQRLPMFSRPLARRFAAIGVGVWLLYLSTRTVTTLHAKEAEGAGGFATDAWQQSTLIASLRRHPLRGHLFSNAAGTCYLLAGLTADEAPEKTDGAQAFEPIQDALDDETPTYLIWFRIEPSPEFVSDTEWRTRYRLTVVQNTDDGTIYRVASVR